MVYKVVDFFCGAGGFSEGFHQAGFEIIKAFDIWEPAINTHNKNHSGKKTIASFGDVREISRLNDSDFEKIVPDSEIIIGSPPCVAFSNSNKSGKADKTLGLELLESYLRVVARKMSKTDSILKYWILENVTNVKNYIKDEYTMSDLGLDGDFILKVKNESSCEYNMKYFGVPSNRKRYICGFFPAPVPTHTDNNLISLGAVIDSLGDPNEKKDKYIKDINFNFRMIGRNVTDHHYINEIARFEWEKAKRHKLDKGYMGKMSFPENLDKPGRTILATMSAASRESFILPFRNEQYRHPTIRELATVMSFPIDYRFYGDSVASKFKLVGNAVPPKFSYALAKAIVDNDKQENNLSTKRKRFKKDDDFFNLNGTEFPVKEERIKNIQAKYRYHIPYMIINTYRVELFNYFDCNDKVSWAVEIHKGQGKYAKVYTPSLLNISFIENSYKVKIDTFISKMVSEINCFEELQNNYRQPFEVRRRTQLIGPDEF